jgi:hypothetical protein
MKRSIRECVESIGFVVGHASMECVIAAREMELSDLEEIALIRNSNVFRIIHLPNPDDLPTYEFLTRAGYDRGAQ